MTSLIRRRWKWLAVCTVAIPALTFAAAPEWSRDALLEIRDYSENCKVIADESEHSVDMQDDLEIVRNRLMMKESILSGVIEGSLTLSEAGEHFLELERENEFVFPSMYRPGSLKECSQSRVIQFLKIRLRQHGSETAYSNEGKGIIKRLELDFESRFGYPPPLE